MTAGDDEKRWNVREKEESEEKRKMSEKKAARSGRRITILPRPIFNVGQ